jgi:hypothetical protein
MMIMAEEGKAQRSADWGVAAVLQLTCYNFAGSPVPVVVVPAAVCRTPS